MVKPKRKKHRLKAMSYRKHAIAVVVIALVAITGVVVLTSSHASGPYTNVEASTGTLTGSATSVTDTAASNGQAVQFGSASSGSGPVSGCYDFNSSGAKVSTTCTDGCSYSGTAAPCMNGTSSGTGTSGWGSPAFDDEFDGSSLDTSRWVAVTWNGNDPNNVKESDGDLVLTAPEANSQALVTSDSSLGAGSNGYYLPVGGVVEARVNMPDPSSCVWATFWTTSNNGNWPAAGEVDIIEGNPPNPCATTNYHLNYHWGPSSNEGSSTPYSYGSVSGSFHTYTFVRGSGNNGYKLYLDGNQVAQWTSSDNGGDEAIEMSLGNSYGNFPDQMVVDYVRAWQ